MKENTAMQQVGSGADRLDSFFTRRGFVKVSAAFVAGMVALGLLPDTAAAAPTSSKGEVDYYATPAHVLKVNGFVKVSAAFVAGMVALGLLPDTAAAAPTSSKGEVDYYATPAHVLKVNRAR